MLYLLRHYNYTINAWVMTGVLCTAYPVDGMAAGISQSNGAGQTERSYEAAAGNAQNDELRDWSAEAAGLEAIEPATGEPALAEVNYEISTQISPAKFIAVDSQATTSAAGNDFSTIARNINTSLEEIPGLISGLSYLIGTLLGVLGILKVKDHVENPQQTELKQGAIRMAAGGGLFALPIVHEAMQNTIGEVNNVVQPAKLNRAAFSVR